MQFLNQLLFYSFNSFRRSLLNKFKFSPASTFSFEQDGKQEKQGWKHHHLTDLSKTLVETPNQGNEALTTG